jgi:hypothetical protein
MAGLIQQFRLYRINEQSPKAKAILNVLQTCHFDTTGAFYRNCKNERIEVVVMGKLHGYSIKIRNSIKSSKINIEKSKLMISFCRFQSKKLGLHSLMNLASLG